MGGGEHSDIGERLKYIRGHDPFVLIQFPLLLSLSVAAMQYALSVYGNRPLLSRALQEASFLSFLFLCLLLLICFR